MTNNEFSYMTAGELFVRLFERYVGEAPQIEESQCSFYRVTEREEDLFPRIIVRYKNGLRVMASLSEEDGVAKYALGLRYDYHTRVDETKIETGYEVDVHWIYEVTLDKTTPNRFFENISFESDYVDDTNEREIENMKTDEIHDMISRAMRTAGESMRLDYYGIDSLQDAFESELLDRIEEAHEDEESQD